VKRILFINSKRPDYLEDMVFSGLSEILGNENLIPYPVNYHYYFSKYSYPKNMGQCRNIFGIIPDWLRSRSALVSMDFDCVILGSAKKDVFEKYMAFIDILPKDLPVVFIDGGDWAEIGGDADRENWLDLFSEVVKKRDFNWVFKREYLLNKKYDKNVFPLPMAYKGPEIMIPNSQRFDVVFWAVESHPVRTRALEILEDKYDCKSNGTVRGQKFRKYARKGHSYLDELAAAKIACNFRGVGWDTLRYWEIPAVGSLMISEPPGIEISNNFVDGQHAVFCEENLSNLTDLIDYYLKNEEERKQIAAAGKNHLLKYHLYKHRAEYILSIINL